MLTTIEQLEAVYAQPAERALRKEIPYVNDDYRAFIAAAPFAVLATSGLDGLDCSPRGDAPGFVRIVGERTLALPDRPGNNRVDSLRNVIVDPRVALLFAVPGVGETLVWARALLAVGDEADLDETLGAALKVHEDVVRVRERKVLEGV